MTADTDGGSSKCIEIAAISIVLNVPITPLAADMSACFFCLFSMIKWAGLGTLVAAPAVMTLGIALLAATFTIDC